MRSVKRILAVYLTFAMAFQLFAPTTGALAEELNVVSDATAQQAGSSESADGGGSSADAGAASGDGASASDDASAGGSETASDDAASGDAAAGDASESQEPAADESASAGDDAADVQDAPAMVAAGATIATVAELKKAMGDHGDVTATGDIVTAITFNDAVGLRIISNADPQLYQTATLTRGGQTGDALDLSSPDGGYTFLGFGSETYPFQGSFDTNGTSIALATSLFNNVELNSGIHIPNLIWKGEGSEPVIAANVEGGGQDLTVTIQIADPVSVKVQESTAGITSALFGTVSGQLSLSATYSFWGTRKGLGATADATGNVGLLANTVANGEFAVRSVDFSNQVVSGGTVKATNGNAGLLVGSVNDGAFLRVGSLNNVPTATIESKSGCAGGVVGKVGSNTGATVEVTSAINLSNLTVKGTAAAGGFIGQATKLTLGAENKKVTCPKTVGDKDSGNVGGFIGEVSFGTSVDFAGNDQIDTGNEGVTLAGKSNESNGVGAAIGKLNFDDLTATVSFKDGTFKSTFGSGGGAAVFGGLVGSVTGCANSKPLRIESVTTEFALEASPNFTGGLVGWLGRGTGATLEVKNASVNCTKLVQSGKGFGGVAGCIDNASIADINGITVQNKEEITKGAGIAAESWRSAIRLGGVTDFSGMSIAENDAVAQIALVRADAPTLVFARGTGSDTDTSTDDCWVYKRCAAKKVDDLGGAKGVGWGYGQVIRLDGDTLKKDLIKINMDEHKLEGPSTTDWKWQIGFDTETKWSEGNRVLNIKSTQDFVCLALSVQFANLWNGVYGFGATDGSALLGSDVTINLNADVNLSGTGVVGLGFDSANNLQTFKGTFNGNNHKIILAIGEPYGMRGNVVVDSNDPGNGKIYRHTRLGLFAAIGGGSTANDPTATVNNLTVDGSIKFDNGLGVDAGSLAATITGNATLSGVTCNAAITCDDTFGNDANIGGIAGSVRGGGTVSFDNNTSGSTKAQATINTGATLNGSTRIGGAIGYVADVASTFNVASLEIGRSVKAGESASGKIAQVGGFIGCIAQSTYKEGKIDSSAEKNVNITGLSFNSFNMTVGKNGDAKKGAGGLLGYSWGNAVVTIGDSSKNISDSTYALKTNSASITANDSEELGGLVYAASGHWIINDYAIDLSKATIDADKAKVLGLLIGRGSRVENSATYGAETYSGLYLENRANWDTAYKVHDVAAGNGVAINNTAINSQDSKTSFDEWVGNGTRPAYGTKAGSKLMDGEWNTVVSLHTKDAINDGKLDMSGVPAQDNSYHNRSDFGKKHNTNAWTRYYYNLDKAYAEVGNSPKNSSASNWMDSPEYLLLWCAYLYAPSKIRSYIIPKNQQIFQGNKIGAEDGQSASIDMDGYSFYPSNPVSGSKVTVKNANIKFHYSKINAGQDGNKKNSEATQHENMHCGLIRTHAGDLTVSSVTLGGTVGAVVNDSGSSSGALVCRYIYGSSNSSSTSIRQISIDGLTLDGLTVDGAADKTYAPLLINEMQTYVNLDAKNITTTGYANGTKAATSLFGKLGVGSAADQVTATFSLINLPSAKDNTIFTRASLLESFGYGEGKTGSAVYTFFKADQDNSKVTFGSEIDANGVNNEYVGKQLWYYDEEGYGTDDNLVKVGSTVADKTGKSPSFGDYLPYVKTGKANKNNVQYHEIKVNQRVPKLTTGCGTYGDPYAITKATELNAVAEYINTQNPSDGWEVTIAANQETLCQRRSSSADTANEVTYVYKQAKKTWEKKTGEGTTDPADTLTDSTMHTYLQSAYYSIEPRNEDGTVGEIELDAASFQGLGNLANPFRGVIVGDLADSRTQATIAINNSTSFSKGLIPYSYGSVVKNLKVVYQSDVSAISYTGKDSSYAPGSFFGGVIGCILGGDNIIDGVSVSSHSGPAATIASANTDPLITAAADSLDKSHLVPIGGYVGAVTGGGVIFRNSSNVSDALKPWHKEGTSRYDNPYVGRVIDGYAFSELTGSSLDNTDRNYKINNLNAGGAQRIVTDTSQGRYRGDGITNNLAITTTVKDAQGLLVLSAIISSGAGGGSANTTAANESYGTYAGSRAYFGGNMSKNATYKFGNQNYGKVRNASYAAVGKPTQVGGDFTKANNDDRLSPGSQWEGDALAGGNGNQVNSPYLVAKYATWQTGNICAAQASGMDLQFVNTDKDIDYDMTPYGTGYTGLSGRYYSNACASDKGADRDRIVPLVATINGNGATIKVGDKDGTAYDIKEYTDDDYKLTGVGALFSTVTYTSENVAGSIGTAAADDTAATGNGGYTVQNLKFEGCNISLTYTDAADKASSSSDEQVGVGLLAGTTANASSLKDYGKYYAVTLENCKVNGSAGVFNVGGLLGSSGYGSRKGKTNKGDTGMVTSNDITNTETRYSPVKLYNCSYSNMEISGVKNVGGFVGKLNSKSQGGVWTTGDTEIAKDSKITSTGANARTGGVLGVNGDLFCVNVDSETKSTNANGTATIKNVNITANSSEGVGGLVGKVESSLYAHGLRVIGSDSSASRTTVGKTGLSSVGGIAGYITGGDEFSFNSCQVKNIDLKATNCSGGIIGQLQVASKKVICNDAELRGLSFNGSWSGGVFGNVNYNMKSPTSIEVTNSIIADNTFSGSWSGGISGDGKGIFRLVNVLIDGGAFNVKDQQGVLFGAAVATNMYELYAAGLDVRPGKDKSNDDLLVLLRTNGTNVNDVNKKSYIAFGDYNDTLSVPGATLYGDVANGTTEAASPYVTTSPMSGIAVRVSDTDTTDRYLFGDGANVGLAWTIKDQAEAGTNVTGRYIYTNIGGRDDSGAYRNTNDYSDTSAQSYNSENNSDISKQVAAEKDFNVLEIPGQDTTTVTNYLNLVTNGGFSDAVRLNKGASKPYVEAKVEKFELKQKGNNKVFVKSSDPASLSVVYNGTDKMQFRASSNWDNDKGQFTLLSVTFNDGADHTYKVQVPIVVKRLFEVNFAATYTYGTNFKADDYSSKDAHVLTGVGDAMTGYLTWTYNKAGANNTQYGWNTYLQGGGSMKAPEKTLLFGGDGPKGTLPAGTQLTLVDTANNNKEYHYTVGPDGAASVALTDFVDSDGSDKKHYEEQWLSELMGVKASVNNSSGVWVKTSADDRNAGARIKTSTGYDYFRPWVSGDTGDRYDLAPTLENESELHPSESFFLVVRVPQKSTATVNGYTGTSLSSGVNTRINYVKRSNESETDRHDNTASTYSVASGYSQTLVDNRQNPNGTEGTQVMSVDTTNYFMMDVTDTVDCGKNQYNSSDTLYYQLNSSLASYNASNNGFVLTGASGYPSGTSGTYSFYVKVGDTYYKPSKSTDSAGNVKWTWTAAGTGEADAGKAAVSGKSWSADGGDMQLVLSDSEGTAIDLSGIRKIATDATNATGENVPFSIQMKADLQMSGPACQNAIAASEDELSAYTKPTYRSFLSPHADTLSTSTMTDDNNGMMCYYRTGVGASTIALTATKKTQLGINVDDLATADGTIALAATYDLSKLSGADEKLSKATSATFTLTLQKRKDDKDGGYDSVPIADYLSVQESSKLGTGTVSDDGYSIVFTDAAFNSVLATRDGSSPILRLGFVVKVNTDVEKAQHFYANYRLVMTAHLSGNGVDDKPVNASGSIVGYANSDYVTYTLTRVHMEGISHG